jgi:endonuclease VIII
VPEGDTIFRTARTLQRAIGGRLVTGFETVLPAIQRVHDDHPVTGRTVDRCWAVGKHLLIGFSGGLVLRTHMKMNGSWHVYRPGDAWQRPRLDMRIAIATDAFVAVGFNVPVAEWLDESALPRARALARLGPDLLSPDFDRAAAIGRVRERGPLPIADALLDQRALAGIGNVYKSEVCFLCAVSPFAPVSSLDDMTLGALVDTARRLLRANVVDDGPGAIVTWRGLRRTTHRSDPEERLWVYGREGRPCRRCGAPIRMVKQGDDARVTYFCERCQKT